MMGRASQTEQTWVLGLDGGGSKTALAYVSGAGEVVGPFSAPGINPFDRPDWEAVMRTFLSAHPAPGPLTYASLGLPGYGESPAISARQADVCADLLPGCPHTPMNDVEAAFVGAFAGGPGALLLAGTGSMAWAHDGARQLRTGGWGEGFGDEGSAYWIGRRALGLASQALDGRHQDAAFAQVLLTPVLDGPPTQPGLLTWFYAQGHARSAVAGLARSVNALAEDGQPTARSILLEAAQLLAQHVTATRQGLGCPGLPWSYAGSVLGSRTVLDELITRLGPPQPPALPPLGGAVFHAATRAGFDTTTVWRTHVRAALLHPSDSTPLLQEQP
ncbi:N-acetylglucosamine kinase [Deinococcus humi]|uniref:N-acetylglucosamine kinase n=1 Tax=Deinococcus humi TaxID=662880 RepID=A0A7W8JZP5_9DEIO|nr:BadF/BadG/BcrA/BcrD ATPase family protein [Deinococcus humi]MBB5366200.1 N-acetylglucosamine kinase [Deinococcus humi]GGO40835.1 N-acetylglucosamine kinase [Deinococcus humi]